MDVWRWKYPPGTVFTPVTLPYNTLSRNDLIYASAGLLLKMNGVLVLPRDISDHSPLLCGLQTLTLPADRLWRLSRYWRDQTGVSPLPRVFCLGNQTRGYSPRVYFWGKGYRGGFHTRDDLVIRRHPAVP